MMHKIWNANEWSINIRIYENWDVTASGSMGLESSTLALSRSLATPPIQGMPGLDPVSLEDTSSITTQCTTMEATTMEEMGTTATTATSRMVVLALSSIQLQLRRIWITSPASSVRRRDTMPLNVPRTSREMETATATLQQRIPILFLELRWITLMLKRSMITPILWLVSFC